MLRLMILPALLALATCGSTDDLRAITVDEDFEMAPGDTLRVMNEAGDDLEGLLIFESVYEDSRCPLNVDCVWAGEATVRLRLLYADETEHTATLTVPGLRPEGVPYEEAYRATMAGYVVHFTRLDPYAEAHTAGTDARGHFRLERIFR
jgi:hypothetical protein